MKPASGRIRCISAIKRAPTSRVANCMTKITVNIETTAVTSNIFMVRPRNALQLSVLSQLPLLRVLHRVLFIPAIFLSTGCIGKDEEVACGQVSFSTVCDHLPKCTWSETSHMCLDSDAKTRCDHQYVSILSKLECAYGAEVILAC